MGDYLLENFVNVKPGEPYRLFPFGRLVKNGQVREITPELAAKFRLPHFKPAVKLGSHEDTTPAGGHIVGLEVRSDGLYAVPEFNDKGAQALADGAYRYHSPEVIWAGGLEDPSTGELIPGPLIVGDALLHTPHLGEAAALYSIEPNPDKRGENMTENTVEVPKSLWEKFEAWFDRMVTPPAVEPEPKQSPEPVQAEEPDKFAAIEAERDQFKAQLEAIQAEAARKSRVDTFAAKLAETKVAEGAEMLAGMSDEQAGWVLTQFAALSAQVKASELFGEKGTEGEGAPADPQQALDVAIKAKMTEGKLGYVQAFEALRSEKPELFKL